MTTSTRWTDNIRHNITEDEHLDDCHKYRMLFLGFSHGVGLMERGIGDRHILFVLLTEDDEHWFVSQHQASSSHWFSDLLAVVQAAQEWCQNNAEPDICNGIQYGWKFKD